MFIPYLMGGYAVALALLMIGCRVAAKSIPGLRGMRRLWYGLCLAMAALVLIALRPIAPAWLSILVANLALFVCCLMLYCVPADILSVRKPFAPWGIAVIVLALAGFWYFTYLDVRIVARVLIHSAVFATFSAASMVMLLSYRDPEAVPTGSRSALRTATLALAGVQAFAIVLHTVRCILSVLYPPKDYVHIDLIQVGFTYTNMIVSVGASCGLIWLALCVHRRELHAMAQTDSLTGLLNRRAFEDILARELRRANFTRRSLALVLTDIDHFKEVNDAWGHQAGDEVIRRVGQALHSGMRPSDALSRFGGEEFVILLRGEDLEQAEAVAERMRRAIAQLTDLPGGIQITVSMGVAASRSEETPDQLLRRCDEALYRSKRSGRNLVSVHRSSPNQIRVAEAF